MGQGQLLLGPELAPLHCCVCCCVWVLYVPVVLLRFHLSVSHVLRGVRSLGVWSTLLHLALRSKTKRSSELIQHLLRRHHSHRAHLLYLLARLIQMSDQRSQVSSEMCCSISSAQDRENMQAGVFRLEHVCIRARYLGSVRVLGVVG